MTEPITLPEPPEGHFWRILEEHNLFYDFLNLELREHRERKWWHLWDPSRLVYVRQAHSNGGKEATREWVLYAANRIMSDFKETREREELIPNITGDYPPKEYNRA